MPPDRATITVMPTSNGHRRYAMDENEAARLYDEMDREETPVETEQVEEEAVEEETGNEEEAEMPSEEESEEVTDDETPKKIPLKAYTEEKRKRQELERRLQELESKVTTPEPVQTPPTSLEELYLANPAEFNATIEMELAKLEENPYENAAQIRKLTVLQATIPIKAEKVAAQKAQDTQGRFAAELNAEIPDFTAKAATFTKFAKEELGYTDEALQHLSNPYLVGPKAAKQFIVSIAKQYEKTNAASNITRKVVKQPTKVETAGEGFRPAKGETIESMMNKVQKGNMDDWSKVFEKAGL